MTIDAKQAISIARDYIKAMFEGETRSKPTLEEIWFDDSEKVWCVTFGIRHRTVSKNMLMLNQRETADYRTVRVSKDGTPLSIKLHDTVE